LGIATTIVICLKSNEFGFAMCSGLYSSYSFDATLQERTSFLNVMKYVLPIYIGIGFLLYVFCAINKPTNFEHLFNFGMFECLCRSSTKPKK
jgi:hypothetical protein